MPRDDRSGGADAPGVSPPPDTVERLFEALHTGDEPALDGLLPPLRARLRQLAKQRLRDDVDAEDVVQQTLTTLWERRDQLRSRAHLLPFIFQTLRNKIGNHYQKRDRESARRRGVAELEQVPSVDAEAEPEALLVSGELGALVDRGIRICASENPAYGEVLTMLRDGSTAAEIRAQLGDISLNALRTRICRARQRLRKILEERWQVSL